MGTPATKNPLHKLDLDSPSPNSLATSQKYFSEIKTSLANGTAPPQAVLNDTQTSLDIASQLRALPEDASQIRLNYLSTQPDHLRGSLNNVSEEEPRGASKLTINDLLQAAENEQPPDSPDATTLDRTFTDIDQDELTFRPETHRLLRSSPDKATQRKALRARTAYSPICSKLRRSVTLQQDQLHPQQAKPTHNHPSLLDHLLLSRLRNSKSNKKQQRMLAYCQSISRNRVSPSCRLRSLSRPRRLLLKTRKRQSTPRCTSLVRTGRNVNLNLQTSLEVWLHLARNKRDIVQQFHGEFPSSRGTCRALQIDTF